MIIQTESGTFVMNIPLSIFAFIRSLHIVVQNIRTPRSATATTRAAATANTSITTINFEAAGQKTVIRLDFEDLHLRSLIQFCFFHWFRSYFKILNKTGAKVNIILHISPPPR